MIVAPKMSDEPQRLEVLRRYQILDTAKEPFLDGIARHATLFFATPISLISLVDNERQWFKAHVGLNKSETPRDVSFCAHAILNDELMVVEDAANDLRFVDNPLVTGDPHIRFYAGAPLTMENGHSLGTLCIIDRQPRRFHNAEQEALLVLRRAVVDHLELRLARLERNEIKQVCSWCENIADTVDGEVNWLTPFDFVQRTKRVSHGMCPACAEHNRVSNSNASDPYSMVTIDTKNRVVIYKGAREFGLSNLFASISEIKPHLANNPEFAVAWDLTESQIVVRVHDITQLNPKVVETFDSLNARKVAWVVASSADEVIFKLLCEDHLWKTKWQTFSKIRTAQEWCRR